MSGSSSTTKSKQSPWAPQAAHITNAFDQAKGALGTAHGATAPSGFVAGMTPAQMQTFQQMLGYGQNSQAATNMGNAGAQLTQAGTTGATGALNALGGFNPTNQTGQIINDAGQMSDNPHMSGMVDAAMRDANRTASEVTMPSIERNAVAGGNVNSSRRAISEGIVSRGLAEKAGDISANLRGSAYQDGLGLASQNANFNTGASLDAMKSQGALGGSMAGMGIDAQGKAIGAQQGLFDIANQGGAGEQAAQQLSFDEQMAKYGFDTNSPFDALNNYWNIIGSQNWGQQGSQTQTSKPSAWQVIGGLMSAGGSLAGGFR